MENLPNPPCSHAVVYLARGADVGSAASFERFLASYRGFLAGCDHKFYVILKGFVSDDDLDRTRRLFIEAGATPIETSDEGFDIGAYLAAARIVGEDSICFLNTNAEILGAMWLRKLAIHLENPKVGLVGTTGSFESLSGLDPRFAIFPNVHLRSNGFMMSRSLLLEIAGGIKIVEKLDAYLVESGPESLTNQVRRRGLDVLVVGRNGRGYPPRWWPASETFRRLTQDNLLIADNQTRHYMADVWSIKHAMVLNTWGPYVDPLIALPGA